MDRTHLAFSHRPGKPLGAFTLIELLIVVAIVGILAAVAVPNFIRAHVRSTVSAARSDMRTIHTALITYFIDHSRYPPEDAPYQIFRVPNNLTIPTAYLSRIPSDPFASTENRNPAYPLETWKRYYYQNFHQHNVIVGCGIDESSAGMRQYGHWVLNGVGPDRRFSGIVEYDASNGLRSSGDVIVSARSPENQKQEP